MNNANIGRIAELEALQARFAFRVTAALTQSSKELPHDIGERLRVAREGALTAARKARAAAPRPVPATEWLRNSTGTAVFRGTPLWLRLASMAPLVVLVGGLVLIQQWHDREQIHAAAEMDTALLSDTLPPAAYADAGFAEFLRHPEP